MDSLTWLTYSTFSLQDENAHDRRFPLNIGIAGLVIKTGTLVNAKNAKEHPAYDPNVDGYPGVDSK